MDKKSLMCSEKCNFCTSVCQKEFQFWTWHCLSLITKIICVRCQLGYISLHFIGQSCQCYIFFVCADKSPRKTKLVSLPLNSFTVCVSRPKANWKLLKTKIFKNKSQTYSYNFSHSRECLQALTWMRYIKQYLLLHISLFVLDEFDGNIRI